MRTVLIRYNTKQLVFNLNLSLQAHSCIERACLLGAVKCRKLKTDSKYSLCGETLQDEIEKDKKEGFYPFFVSFFFLKILFERLLKIAQVWELWALQAFVRMIIYLKLGRFVSISI